MESGVGTPLSDKSLAGALSGKGGGVLLSGKDATPNSRVSSSGGFHELADQVDLSSEARARLRNDHQALATLQQGRGELAAQDTALVDDRLKQVNKELSFLRDLVREATPAQRKTLVKQLENTGNTLEHIARDPVLKQASNAVLKDLSRTAQSFKELVEEFQKHLDDEERIPPSIFNQMRFLLEKSLAEKPEEASSHHINALA